MGQVRRVNRISDPMNSGRLQDIERIVEADDEYFEQTGINRMTPSRPPSPLIEDDDNDGVEPQVYEAYLRREELKKAKAIEDKKKEYEKMVEEQKANPQSAIDFIEIDDEYQ